MDPDSDYEHAPEDVSAQMKERGAGFTDDMDLYIVSPSTFYLVADLLNVPVLRR